MELTVKALLAILIPILLVTIFGFAKYGFSEAPLDLSVQIEKESIGKSGVQKMSIFSSSNGEAVGKVKLAVILVDTKNNTKSINANTAGTGKWTLSWKINAKSDPGIFTILVSASKDGYASANKTITFTVTPNTEPSSSPTLSSSTLNKPSSVSGTLIINSTKFEVQKDQSTFVSISGKIQNSTGGKVWFTISKPGRITENNIAYITAKGDYSLIYFLDKDAKVGKYSVKAVYHDSEFATADFQLVRKSKPGQLSASTLASYLKKCTGDAQCIVGRIKDIVSGDTLIVESSEVHLSLVNTVEKNLPGFENAKKFTAKLCSVGSIAIVDQDDKQPKDKYGRILGKVYCKNKILNEEILNNGFARLFPRYCLTSEFANEEWAKAGGC